MTSLRVSVVTPCRDEAEHIDRFLDNVTGQRAVPGDLEILIADGRSRDGTRERIERRAESDARIVLLDNPEGTASHGLNRAIDRATGSVIVRMDVHTEYAPDYVALCVRTLLETGADNVGGPARTHALTYFQQANSIAYHSRFSVGGARFHDPTYEGPVDTVVYGCWHRALFDRIGLFDTELVRNMDDEFNLRTIRAGGRLWQNPAIMSWYLPRASLSGLFRQYLQYGYWKVRVIQKHRVPASWRHLVPGSFVLLLTLAAAAATIVPRTAILALVLAGSYMATNLAVSVWTCRSRERWRYLPVMPLVFATYHFGYGIGFVKGIWDFVIRRKGPAAALTALTR